MLGNVKSTLKNSIIYGLGNLSSKVVGFILLPLYTGRLSSAEYGVLGILEVCSQALIAIFGLCLYQAFFRWYWQKEYISRQKSMFYTFLLVNVFSAAILVLCLLPFIKTLSTLLLDSPEYSYIFLLMGISAGIDIINQAPNTLIRLQEKSLLYSMANLLKLTISLSLTVLFITHFGKKIDGIYYAQIIGQIVYFLFVSRFILKNSMPVFETKILKDMFVFSLPLLISVVSVLVLNIADKYIIKFFGTLSDVGIYSLGSKMASTLQIVITTSVSLAISPLIFKMMDAPNHHRFYAKLMTYYIFGLMFFIIGMSVFGKEVIKVMAVKPEYWTAYKFIPILSFSIGFMAIRDIAFTGLYIKKKTFAIGKTIVLISLLSIGLNFLLIYFFSSMGGALASIISQFVYFIVIYVLAQKTYRIPYEINKIVLVFIIGAGLVLMALLTNNLPLIFRLSIKSLLIVSYPLILYPFGFYEDAELRALKGFWIKWKKPARWKENLANIKL